MYVLYDVCIYVYVYVYMYVCMYTCMHAFRALASVTFTSPS